MAEHCVYLYRTQGGAPKHVGHRHHLTRALSHAEHSHKQRLREWLRADKFDLTVSGRYRDEAEAKAVEAALISALGPEFNVAPGDGPRLSPDQTPPPTQLLANTGSLNEGLGPKTLDKPFPMTSIAL